MMPIQGVWTKKSFIPFRKSMDLLHSSRNQKHHTKAIEKVLLDFWQKLTQKPQLSDYIGRSSFQHTFSSRQLPTKENVDLVKDCYPYASSPAISLQPYNLN